LSLFRTDADSFSSYADPSDRGLVSSVSRSNFNSFSRICKEISHVRTLQTTLISCSSPKFKTSKIQLTDHELIFRYRFVKVTATDLLTWMSVMSHHMTIHRKDSTLK
jgi:hypothetical protein